MASQTSLRERQVSSILKALSLDADTPSNHGHDPGANGAPAEQHWKALIFDTMGHKIITSVLTVNDLRRAGVTIHLLLSSTRHSIPDIPSVYFISPDSDALAVVTSDLSRHLYDKAYISFIRPTTRQVLEKFAEDTALSGTSDRLASIYDNFLDYICVDSDLFHLGTDSAYYRLNNPKTTDAELDDLVDTITSGIVSVALNEPALPVIRAPPGGAAEMVAAKVDRKLRDHYLTNKSSNTASGDASTTAGSRPVLIIVDRSVDIRPMLHHSWTYQSLIYDALRVNLGSVSVESTDDSGRKTTKSHFLSKEDFFWTKHAGNPFPQVAEDIDDELNKYKLETAEITKTTGTNPEDVLDAGASTAHLGAAIKKIPELKARKSILDSHMDILSALLNSVKERQLDQYFQLEEDVNKLPKAEIMGILSDPNKGADPMDKLRLFIQWYLSVEHDISRQEFTDFSNALQTAGADTTALQYVKSVRQLTRLTANLQPQQAAPQQGNDLFRGFSSLTDRLQKTNLGARFKESGLGLEGLMKNFLPSNTNSTLTSIVESLIDPQNASTAALSSTENYLFYDPRSGTARGTKSKGIEASFGQKRQSSSTAIAFVVGGACYQEAENLTEWAKRAEGSGLKRRIVYGGTEFLSPAQFIEQLARLGSEQT